MLKKVIRPDDRLLYPGYPGASHFDDPVVAFAERYGLFADPIGGERTPPTLTILIVDPLGDNALSAPARVLATQRRADLIITELPVLID